MKRFLAALLLLTTTACYSKPLDYSFYIKVGSGVSFSDLANVCAPYPPWNPAIQGYNTDVGNAPIGSVSIGCELAHVMDLEINLANRSTFKYRKFQTPISGGASYTREFDLNATSVLVCANILGKGMDRFNRDIGCGTIYPIIGAGIGASNLLITNYRTTGLPPTGDSAPYASFSSENQYTMRRTFTYTLLMGLEYNHNDDWAIGTGYRWFNAGCFKGPRFQRVASGAAVDVGCDAWHLRLRANEWFIEFKIFI